MKKIMTTIMMCIMLCGGIMLAGCNDASGETDKFTNRSEIVELVEGIIEENYGDEIAVSYNETEANKLTINIDMQDYYEFEHESVEEEIASAMESYTQLTVTFSSCPPVLNVTINAI